jgi:hypothetical protein
MPHITITFKDGSVKEFEEKYRAGGSWTNSVEYKGAFAVIVDEWGNKTAFPSSDIKEINITR